MIKTLLAILFTFVIVFCANGKSNQLHNFYNYDPVIEHKVDEVFNSLNDTTRVAQMIITSAVDRTFDTAIKLISNFDTTKFNDRLDYLGLNRTKRQILLLLADHISHHRGQMIVYLRLNDIKPPRYILYQ